MRLVRLQNENETLIFVVCQLFSRSRCLFTLSVFTQVFSLLCFPCSYAYVKLLCHAFDFIPLCLLCFLLMLVLSFKRSNIRASIVVHKTRLHYVPCSTMPRKQASNKVVYGIRDHRYFWAQGSHSGSFYGLSFRFQIGISV